jgi:hypothetical protein
MSSQCCNAAMDVGGKEGGTRWLVCKACGNACNPKSAYRWLQLGFACTAIAAVLAVSLLTSCASSVTTPKGYTFTFNVDGETAAILVSKKFGLSGKETMNVLP